MLNELLTSLGVDLSRHAGTDLAVSSPRDGTPLVRLRSVGAGCMAIFGPQDEYQIPGPGSTGNFPGIRHPADRRWYPRLDLNQQPPD